MEDNTTKIKLNKLYNDTLDFQIKRHLKEINKNTIIPKESIIFLEAANNSIKNSLKLIEKDEYVDSLCLLRSSFEAILFSLAIYFDKDVYKFYKHHDKKIYIKSLKDKYKKIMKKNPKFIPPKDIEKEIKDHLAPKNIRKVVAKNYKSIFNDIYFDCDSEAKVEEELSEFYSYLCDFTHPSIVKTCTYKLQNDIEELDNIRIIFKLNINYCKLLLLVSLNLFTFKDNVEDIYDLYMVIFLTDLNLIGDVQNLKRLFKKYDEYLYLDITKRYFNKKTKEINEIRCELKKLNEMEDINDKILGLMKNVLLKYSSEKIIKKYFNN